MPHSQDDLAPSGARARVNANIAALRILRQLEAEDRPATSEEQRALARWAGWGAQGVPQVFDETRAEYEGDRDQLHTLLNEQEYAAAQRTMLNAHYTDPAYVTHVWDALAGLGFRGGEVLEPGCGAGTFIGMAPGAAHMTGVELDPVTAAIASHLYPDAIIRAESFTDTTYPAGHFDAAIGNVPFADVKLNDPVHNPGRRLAMHNHFIYKALDYTRPGGMVAVLTSQFTMDSANPEARRLIADRADLVGAVRLPTGAHRRAAGTDAVTDLLILRVRDITEQPQPAEWLAAEPMEMTGPHGPERIRINRYFADHPENVLGQMSAAIGMYGVVGLRVEPRGDVGDQLHDRLAGIAAHAQARGLTFTERQPATTRPAAQTVALDAEIDGHIRTTGDGFEVRAQGMYAPLNVPKTQHAELAALLQLRDQARALIEHEARDLNDTAELRKDRAQLHDSWQTYITTYGPINRFRQTPTGKLNDGGELVMSRRMPPAVKLLIRTDPYGPLVAALESFDELDQTAHPAALLRERQIVPRHPILGTDDPIEALQVSLDTDGHVNLETIAGLLGADAETAREQLGDAIFAVPLAGDDPGQPAWVTAAEYLSGDVRTKLETATAAAAADPAWMANVEALRAVIPADLGPGDISPRLGAVWIPAEDHQRFMHEVLSDPSGKVQNYGGAAWNVEGNKWSIQAVNEWGTRRMPAPELIERLMTQKQIVVNDMIDDGDRKRAVLNPTETQAAQDKAELLQERFAAWLWEDPEREARLVTTYNQMFNNLRLRDYSTEGEYLKLPGLAKNFTPMPHQRAAVARMLNEPSVGLFHEVGAGKTAEMVIGIMEMRRLGLITKPAVVVPNHMLEQFSREWLQLYPQAKILAASSKDLRKDARRQFIARAATNDWDAIVLTSRAFESIPLSPDHQAAYIEKEKTALTAQIEAAYERGDSSNRTLKGIEKKLERREEQIKAKLGQLRDPGLTFEETGIDYLVVDEFHRYKNLSTFSHIAGAGIDGSNMASDMDMKLSYLRAENGDRVLTSATATPIANSVAEMYVMQRYHAPQTLEAAGITDFDSWAATFGNVVTSMEINVVGDKFTPKDRFAQFQNVPELLTMFHQFGDIKTAEDLALPRPEVAARPDGQRTQEVLTVQPSPSLLDYIGKLSDRVDKIASGAVNPHDDNMLSISSDGRAAALDMRLVTDPTHWNALDVQQTKIQAAADRLTRVWAENADTIYLDPDTGEPSPRPGALQIVFCDFSTPNTDGRWNVYDELRADLYKRGMPQGSVRFIHEARNDEEKARLFAACRSGEVAVIIGSSEKMGVGTNIQDRAIHLLQMDAPWRPADVAQRIGRALRRGNQNPEVQLTQVTTERSFDTYMWQTLERKAAFINQIMSGKLNGEREIEDIGDTTMNFTEFKAIASNNPLLLEQAEAQADLKRWQSRATGHQRNQDDLKRRIKTDQEYIAKAQEELPQYRAAADRSIDTTGEQFTMTVEGRRYGKRADAAQALDIWIRDPANIWPGRSQDHGAIATVGGHDITLRYDRDSVYLGLADLPQVHNSIAMRDLAGVTGTGLVTRCENLTKNLDKKANERQIKAEEAAQRIDKAQLSYGQPFPHAAELRAAQRRYDTITSKLTTANETEGDQREQAAAPVVGIRHEAVTQSIA